MKKRTGNIIYGGNIVFELCLYYYLSGHLILVKGMTYNYISIALTTFLYDSSLFSYYDDTLKISGVNYINSNYVLLRAPRFNKKMILLFYCMVAFIILPICSRYILRRV